MALKAGSVEHFEDSMAEAMETAFKSEWQSVKGTALRALGEEDRKILFAAIAQGVVNHLKQRARDAFIIEVRVTQTNEVWIKSDNTKSIDAGGWSFPAGLVDVEQEQLPDNMLVSEGSGTITEVVTE